MENVVSVFSWLVILYIKIHLVNAYEFVINTEPPDFTNYMYTENYERLPPISSAIATPEENLSDIPTFYRHRENKDPCAILLACLLLTKSQPQIKNSGVHYNPSKTQSLYDDSLLGEEKYFQSEHRENSISSKNNIHVESNDANHVVNETFGYITKLCKTDNVQRYLRGVDVDDFTESCKLDEYDLTHIFSQLIYLADSSIPTNDNSILSRATTIQKKSDQYPLYEHSLDASNNQHYLLAKSNQSTNRRSDSLRQWRRKKKRRRKSQKKQWQSLTNYLRNNYYSKRKQIKILDNMGPNAKFYGRYLWKPPNSELHNPVCRECEEKRSACFTYYMATYGVCGVVWYVEFITDTDGLVGDYFKPATTLCNLATYPRTFDCVWNTFQNCYRKNCGLIGFEWAALPKLKGTVLG